MAAETTAATKTTGKGTAVKTQDVAVSELFTNQVIKEFGKNAGGDLNLTVYQKRLAQHLFIKIDASLKELEKKRLAKGKQGSPIAWANVNMQKLAVDAMHRVELGLDALIPNHIHVIPYWNTSAGKYDLDLRIGYVGRDYYKRQMALNPPDDITYELVYANDTFKAVKKSIKNPVESYEFEIPEPFNRGEVIGGFAYIWYSDDTNKNKLIIVTAKDFDKSKSKAQSPDFWNAYPDEMKYSKLVTKATNKLQIDPEKVNEAFMSAERDEDAIDVEVVKAEIEKNANTGPVLEIEAEKQEETTQGTEVVEEKEEAKQEKKPGQTARMPGF